MAPTQGSHIVLPEEAEITNDPDPGQQGRAPQQDTAHVVVGQVLEGGQTGVKRVAVPARRLSGETNQPLSVFRF